MTWRRKWIAVGLIAAGGVVAGTSVASANGSETLGDPSIGTADGDGIAVAGTGLFSGSGSMTVEVPAAATVEQVLLYFEVGDRAGSGKPLDDSITVNGTTVTCPSIGGPTPFYADVEASSFRCDITALGIVGPGSSTLDVSGLDNDINDGAGVLVIYNGGGNATVSVVDGNDIAFVDFAPPLRATVPQTFTFEPADVERTADLALMVGSIGNGQEPQPRPSQLKVTVDGLPAEVTWDPFGPSSDGPQFDTGLFEVVVPAGAGSVTVEMASEWGRPGLPASLVWVSAGFAIGNPAAPPVTAPPLTVAPAAALPSSGARPDQRGAAPVAVQSPPPTVSPVGVLPRTVSQGQLPVTGTDTTARLVFGAAVAAAGISLLAASRKRDSLRPLPVQR